MQLLPPRPLRGSPKSPRKFLIHLLVVPGRAHFSNLSCYGVYAARAHARWYDRALDFAALNLVGSGGA